jgi:hypothetical protein
MPRARRPSPAAQTIAVLLLVFFIAALLLWSGLDQSGVKP